MTDKKPESWEEVERLVSEQKFQAALDMTSALRAIAVESGDTDEQTRALIKEVQLRSGLHGYETAVRFLRDTPWPDGPRERLILELFYARSLVHYLQAYSWEIGQRERVAVGAEDGVGGTVDLKAWTRDQIAAEAHRSYASVWPEREAWGGESLGSLAEYIQQNDYPARIRGTLRDAVTYLWVELLANTALWGPEQSNETWRLDRDALLTGNGAAEGAVIDLASVDEHPLVKISHLLDDLETWHRTHDRPEAMLEARLERLRRLRASFDQDIDRKAIESNLQGHLDTFPRGLPWWSMGVAALADMWRGSGELVRAHGLATRGREAHPKAPGGRRCHAIIEAIEAPFYSLQAMAVDGAGKRSIQVHHKNLETLHFRAYAIDLESTVVQGKDYNLLPSHREIDQIITAQKPVAQWQVDLPLTPDFEAHHTYVTPPLDGPGLHVVIASARQDFNQRSNQMIGVHLLLSDLVILGRSLDIGFEITVRSGATGRPVAGADVSIYRNDWRQGHQRIQRHTSGDDGRVLVKDLSHRAQHFAIARLGDDASILRGLGQHNPYSGELKASLVYTDRSVYRPGQTLHWKAVSYAGSQDTGQYEVIGDETLEVSLRDANYEEVERQTVETNDFGSASGSFTIPTGRLLGSWTLQVTGAEGRQEIRVEEYKRPTFEVTLDEPAEALRLNRPATLRGEARYYFGLPVTSGALTWQVMRAPVYPRWWWWNPGPQGRQTVASGEMEIGPDGTFEVTFTPEADERLAEDEGSKGLSYRYELSVDLADEGGETRSTSRAFRLGFVAVEAQLDLGAGFFDQGQAVQLAIDRRDLDGVARAGEGRYRLVALDQPEETPLPADLPVARPPGDDGHQTPGDLLAPRWQGIRDFEHILNQWSDGAEQRQGTLEHGTDGRAELDLGTLETGAWRLHYTTTDPFGAEYERAWEFVVVGDGAELALPLVLRVERPIVSVGDTARVFVHSGLPDQEMVFEITRQNKRLERRVLRSSGGPQVVEIPIDESLRGGFGVRLTALRDHQRMQFIQTLQVPWDDRRLSIEFATFRDRLRPGAEETWRVVVRGDDEAALAAGAAEVLAYMYDRSLDIFASHEPPNPMFLYPASAWGPWDVYANLGQGGQVWSSRGPWFRLPSDVHFQGDRLKFYDSYGSGGVYGAGGPGRRRTKSMPLQAMAMRSEGLDMAAAAVPESAMMADLQEESIVVESETTALLARDEYDGDGTEAPGDPPSADGPVPLRTDFSETAFFEPHLIVGDDGSVSFEFQVPDSVTEWNVWVHALTRDLRIGREMRKVRTVKDLLVRPYLPRFLREGDRADLRVVINNASEEPLAGHLDFDILDPETESSLLEDFGLTAERASGLAFEVEPGGGTTLEFPIAAPKRVGPLLVRAVARAGDLSDGEQRGIPVLPSRLHLAQSRFAALQDADRRELHFEDLAADDDPTRDNEQLIVTLDAQLFYGVLSALPYLVDYPYECTEQTLNRFLSSGIVSSVFDRYPVVAAMAKTLAAERDTLLEQWDDDDPNRKLLLEESPWLRQARGGDIPGSELTKVLDPEIARAERAKAIGQLEKTQTSLGGFPWWPGGPPSPYMTLYLLNGFSRALEFGVDVPQDMVVKAWQYMQRHYVRELADKRECCWEMVTFLNYVLSSYPDASWTGGVFSDDDRRSMLEFSFEHWKKHSPLSKGQLALTLHRAERAGDARLVWDSVMDSAKTERDLGTYWAPEDRAWLWYNDTVDTHAFALRVLTELEPNDPRRQGLVQWLFLDKKLGHWKSTRATAEVIYALVHYLDREDQLGQREAATVSLGPIRRDFVFEPDEYTGKKNQLIVPGPDVESSMATVVVEKETPGLLFASATWHFATDQLPDEAEGDFFHVERSYFLRQHDGKEWTLKPLEDGVVLTPGDQVEVHLSIRTKHAAEYVHLRDPRGAGFEPETLTSGYRWDLGLGYYEEVRDSGANFFFDWLPVGEYTFKYRLRANLGGTFRVGPATLQSMYAPEFVGYSSGAVLEVGGE